MSIQSAVPIIVPLITVILSSLIVICGWIISHQLTTLRDRDNKIREQRLAYIVKTYRTLAKASNHPRLHEIGEEFQEALADIQFLGTKQQVDFARQIIDAFLRKKPAKLDPLLNSLRDELRQELNREKLTTNIMWLRIEPKVDKRA